MRLFKPRSDPAGRRTSTSGIAATADGAAAAVLAERSAGSTAALPGTGAAQRATELWRSESGGEAGEPPPPRCECGTEAAALAAAAGMTEAGLRATAFLSSSAVVSAHELLYAIAGKRLPLVLHMAAQAAPRVGSTEGAGHDGYHAVADAGWFQAFAWDAQSAADLALIARKLAELALVPGLLAQDAWQTTHRTTPLRLLEPAQVQAFLGNPADAIVSPTPAQRLLYGERRRRLPAIWNVDAPLLSGAMHPAGEGAGNGAGTYADAVAAQGPFGLEHVAELAATVAAEFGALTGRSYAPLLTQRCEDAQWLLVAQGSAVPLAQAVADHLRATRKVRVGVVNVVVLRPFPGALLADLLQGRKGVLVLERAATALSGDAPLTTALRVAAGKALENGSAGGEVPHPGYPRWKRGSECPALLTATYGLGGRTLDPGALLAAFERLEERERRGTGTARLNLDSAFAARHPLTPKQEILAQQVADAYPGLADRSIAAAPGADLVPALLPAGAMVVHCHAAAGRQPFAAATDPGPWCHDLAGLHVESWPQAGQPRRGAPTRHTLIAAAVPFPGGCEPRAADVVIAADAAGLRDPALVAALKPGGVLIVVPEGADAPVLPEPVRRAVATLGVHTYRCDAWALAREEARDPVAQGQAFGRLLLGALLTAPPMAALTGLRDSALLREVKSVLLRRHPRAEVNELEAELALYRTGTEALLPWAPAAPDAPAPPEAQAPLGIASTAQAGAQRADASPELKRLPAHPLPLHDLHRHAEAHPQSRQVQTAGPQGADPFAGAGVLPPATGLLRDFSALRATAPHWLPQRCTGCGACWAICPDAALPALVNTPAEVLEAAVGVLETQGHPTELLPRLVRVLDGKWRGRLQAGGAAPDPVACLQAALADTLPAARLTPDERDAGAQALEHLHAAVAPYALAVTAPFFGEPESLASGSGGLLSVTLDPERCKGCGACVRACGEDALELEPQTPERLERQRARWAFWLRLPSTAPVYRALGQDRATPPGPETLLLDKRVYRALVGGSETPPGAAESTVLHLFAAAAEAALQPATEAHRARLEDLIAGLETHLRARLAVDVSDVNALRRALNAAGAADLTLADLSRQVDRDGAPIDTRWLERVTATLAGLQRQRQDYAQGDGGRPRAGLGVVVALNGITAPLATFPHNAFAFPASGQAVQAAAATALGVSAGHLARMAADFRLVRIAQLELDDKYNPAVHDGFFRDFGPQAFSAAEWALCPPVVLVGDDAALAHADGGAVLALLRSGRPLKVLCLDGHVYRELAAQPGTLPAWGEAASGTEEGHPAQGAAPPELGLLGVVQGGAYVEQGSLADVPRLLDGFLRGLRSPRPALFTVFRAELPDHGAGDALAADQSRLALAARAHPALRFDPDAGEALAGRLSLHGNPAPAEVWATRAAAGGANGTGQETLTFADFALSIPSLAHHFSALPADADPDGLTTVDAWLELDAEERRESRPVVWAADGAGGRRAWAVSHALTLAVTQRRAVWRLLRALTREDLIPVDEAAIAQRARDEVSETVLRNLMTLAAGDGGGLAEALTALADAGAGAGAGDKPAGGSHA